MLSGLKIAAPVLEKIKALVAAHGSMWQLVQRLWIVLDANDGLRTVTIMAAIGNWPTGRATSAGERPAFEIVSGQVVVLTLEPLSPTATQWRLCTLLNTIGIAVPFCLGSAKFG